MDLYEKNIFDFIFLFLNSDIFSSELNEHEHKVSYREEQKLKTRKIIFPWIEFSFSNRNDSNAFENAAKEIQGIRCCGHEEGRGRFTLTYEISDIKKLSRSSSTEIDYLSQLQAICYYMIKNIDVRVIDHKIY